MPNLGSLTEILTGDLTADTLVFVEVDPEGTPASGYITYSDLVATLGGGAGVRGHGRISRVSNSVDTIALLASIWTQNTVFDTNSPAAVTAGCTPDQANNRIVLTQDGVWQITCYTSFLYSVASGTDPVRVQHTQEIAVDGVRDSDSEDSANPRGFILSPPGGILEYGKLMSKSYVERSGTDVVITSEFTSIGSNSGITPVNTFIDAVIVG